MLLIPLRPSSVDRPCIRHDLDASWSYLGCVHCLPRDALSVHVLGLPAVRASVMHARAWHSGHGSWLCARAGRFFLGAMATAMW
eukprot:2988742-Alexandrium_andersonii.AAC.1